MKYGDKVWYASIAENTPDTVEQVTVMLHGEQRSTVTRANGARLDPYTKNLYATKVEALLVLRGRLTDRMDRLRDQARGLALEIAEIDMQIAACSTRKPHRLWKNDRWDTKTPIVYRN